MGPKNVLKGTGESRNAKDSGTLPNTRRTPRKHTMFVYGSLMEPSLLSTVLSLSTPPTLRHGTIRGFAIKTWGRYPALVHRAGGKVNGEVFEVSDEQFEALKRYEGPTYRWSECEARILNEDGGKTGEVVEEVRVFCARNERSRDLKDEEWDFEEFREWWRQQN